jgi:hypothetical protein
MPDRSRLVAIVVVVLIAAGAWRLAAIVDATPLLGYANQYDMGRTSACVGLWPDLPAPSRFEAHPQSPIARYVRGERRPDECYPSSELLFVAPAAAIVAPGGKVDLRFVGAIEAALLVALALALAVLLRARPAWALAHGVVFAIVVCDPMNALWLNTLYTEFAALFFLYASVVLLVVIAARESPSSLPPTTHLVAFAFALCGLGLSRQQHLLLPAVLALPAVVSLWRPTLRAALALLALVAVVAYAQIGLLTRAPTIAAANRADVVLGAILPASLDPELTAQRLGLPERCLQSVGATWYVTMGESLQATCPEALAVPRTREALLLMSEPATLGRAALRALPQLQDWRLGYLGSVEGRDYGDAEAVRAIAGSAAFSAAPIVTSLEPAVFLLALTASLVLLGLSAIAALAGAARERRRPLALVLYALTVTAWYAIATAVGGDGYVETARHAQLASASLYAAGVILVTALAAPLLLPLGIGARTALGALAFVVVSGGIAALVQPALRAAMVASPMAIGVVDRPRQNQVRAGVVEIAGWALDPFGVARVIVATETGEAIEAARGLPTVGARGEPLALYYPSYPQVERAGFAAQLPQRLFARGSVDIRTIVFNAAGGHTEIDRRQLVAVPR